MTESMDTEVSHVSLFILLPVHYLSVRLALVTTRGSPSATETIACASSMNGWMNS